MSKAKVKSGILLMLATFGMLFFASFAFDPAGSAKIAAEEKTFSLAAQTIASAEKSKYFYLNKDAGEGPKVAAAAYLVGDLDTGEVILAKNQDQKFPIASVSKLMTALVASEIMSPDDVAEVSSSALSTEGTNGQLKLREKIKISDLLYPLLLESSNDAAEVLAEYFGREIFMGKMNQQAQNLQMSATGYEDPSGLSPNNQSTVSDIFKLTGYLYQHKADLLSITAQKSFSDKKHSWSNTNKLLRKEGYLGGKTGFTDEALQTVVSIFSLPLGKVSARPVAITLLRSPNRAKDVENILKYLKENIYYGGEADAARDWVKEKVGAPRIKDPDFVVLTFAGDIMLDRGVKNSVIKNFNNDYSALFEKLNTAKWLKDSDIVFANLEGPASDTGEDSKNLYTFRMDPSVIPALAGSGINVLSVGNNHMGDFGRLAYIDTLARLRENEIFFTGGGNNNLEAEAPVIIEKYGLKIGFLGFSDVGPEAMQAGVDMAGILSAKNPRLSEIIKNAAKQVDYLAVSFHWGEEYKEKQNARQEFLAHKAIDNGAKIVVGHHPHVAQGAEIYKGSYIAYSLGNFIFDQGFSEKTMEGMLLHVKIKRDGEMTARGDTVKLNRVFQPEAIIKGKEEKIKIGE